MYREIHIELLIKIKSNIYFSEDERRAIGKNHGTDDDDIKSESKMTAGATAVEKTKRHREDESQGIVVQSSGRISKRPKWDYDPYSPPKRTGKQSVLSH